MFLSDEGYRQPVLFFVSDGLNKKAESPKRTFRFYSDGNGAGHRSPKASLPKDYIMPSMPPMAGAAGLSSG